MRRSFAANESGPNLTLRSGAGAGYNYPVDPSTNEIGKTHINLLDLSGSVGESAGNVERATPDPIGSLLGGLGNIATGVLGTIGEIGVPGVVTTKDVVGRAGDVLSAPGRWVERQAAGGQVAQQMELKRALDAAPNEAVRAQMRERFAGMLPADVEAMLDAGMSVDEVADRMVELGRGYSDNPLANIAAQIILDPLNLVSFGAGGAITKARHASGLVRASAEMGTSDRVLGTAYNLLSTGLSKTGRVVALRTLGQSAKGVTRALGQNEIRGVESRFAALGYGDRMAEAMGRATAQTNLAALSRMTEADVGKMILRRDDVNPALRRQVSSGVITEDEVAEFSGSELISQIARPRLGISQADMEQESAEMAARILDTSVDDARRGIKGTEGEWRTLSFNEFGAASGDMVKARAAAIAEGTMKNADRVTLVSPRSLTDNAADDAIEEMEPLLVRPVKGPRGATFDAAVEATAKGPAQRAKADAIAVAFVEKWGDEVSDFTKHLAKLKASDKIKDSRVTAKRLVDYLKQRKGTLPHVVEDVTTGTNPLPTALGVFRKKWGKQWQIGFEPEYGIKTMSLDGEIVPTRMFVPLVDEFTTSGYRNPLGQVVDFLFQGINQKRIIAEAQDRMERLGNEYGLTADESKNVMHEVLSTARRENMTPRGLYDRLHSTTVNGVIEPGVFERALGAQRYAELESKQVQLAFLVNYAFQGNLRTVGATQALSGWAKTESAKRGVLNPVTGITERLYPLLKFQMNPLFIAQEGVEGQFFNFLRGIWPRTKLNPDKNLREMVESLRVNNPSRVTFEGGRDIQLGGAVAINAMIGPKTMWGRFMEKIAPDYHKGLVGIKEYQHDLLVYHDLPVRFVDDWRRVSPVTLTEWETKLGTKDATKIAQAFFEERFALATTQREIVSKGSRAGKTIDDIVAEVEAAGAMPSQEAQTVWNAFVWGVKESGEQAYKTHYYNPSRGFLERTLNHPFMGFYPLSYMYGKVLPELARFLFLHPFGANAPLAGYNAARKVQEAIVTQMEDPEFASFLKDNEGALYLVEMMLPGSPTNLPVNMPAWYRHAFRNAEQGKKYDPTMELQDLGEHVGLLRLPETLGKAYESLPRLLGGLQEQLTGAADDYDGQFPQ